MGFQYDLLSAEQLADDKLAPDVYRLFILPQSLAMTDVEVAKTKSYVSAGGAVLANGVPAVFNHHGIRREEPALAEVFGLTRSDQGRGRASLAEHRLDLALLDKGLTAGDAANMLDNDQPVMFGGRFGQGKAIYLNVDLTDYSALRQVSSQDVRTKGYRRLLAKAFDAAGVEPLLKLTSLDDRALRSEIVTYRAGDATLLAVFYWSQDNPAGAPVQIALPKQYHVVDLDERTYLGQKKTLNVILKGDTQTFYPSDFHCWALLPEKIEDLTLQADRSVSPGEEVNFTIAAGTKMKGTTSVMVTAVDPSGQEVLPYRQSLLLDYGGTEVQGKLKLALNDALGRWQIVARDILSGAEKKLVLYVER